jgi:hypothetical protein
LFARNPNARSVQVCNAYFDESAGRMKGDGMNITWILRETANPR